MMRGALLEHLRESSHLWADAGVAAQVAKDLDKADKLLKESPGKKDALEQVNAAYQAMYCAAQALVHSAHYKATHFRAVLVVLEEHFVKPGKLEKQHVENLLHGQRVEGTPQENLDAAAAFIAAVKALVGK